MKKIIIAILSVLLIFTVISCNDAADPKLFIKAPKTITIKAKNGNTNLKVSSDSTPVAIKTDWTDSSLAPVTVTYVGRGTTTYPESESKPMDAGTYTAKMTVGEKSVTYDFEIK